MTRATLSLSLVSWSVAFLDRTDLGAYPSLSHPSILFFSLFLFFSFFFVPILTRTDGRLARPRSHGAAAAHRTFGKNAYRLSIDLERAPVGSSVWVKGRRSSKLPVSSGSSTPARNLQGTSVSVCVSVFFYLFSVEQYVPHLETWLFKYV